MAQYFFLENDQAARKITDLFDFVWPTAAALWNLRWQVKGFLQVLPDPSPKQLNDRFIWGSDIHGTNLRRACEETSWTEQKARFAAIILTNAFAVYEGWAEAICKHTKPIATAKQLQFSNASSNNGKGIEHCLSLIRNHISPTLDRAYYPIFAGSPKYSLPVISNMLAAFRYFKEVRNCDMHDGGIASQKAEDAYKRLLPVANPSDLGMKGKLDIDPIIVGSPISLHLRGVVGFCDILLRIIATVDAEFGRTVQAEALFKRRLAAVPPRNLVVSGEKNRRHKQILRRCRLAGLPDPVDTEIVYRYLKAEGIARL